MHDQKATGGRTTRRQAKCAWCGRAIVDSETGRRRRYCKQSCRQRAYEQRHALTGTRIPVDAVILTQDEADAVVDRLFEVRCAAEDVATAAAEGTTAGELAELCERLVELARDAERLR